MTGVGAAISDIIYALLTGLGMSFVMDFINDPTRKFVLQLSGSVILLLFGIYSFRSDPMRYSHKGSGKNGRGTLLHNGVTAFLVCFANPLIVFLFMALFAQFAFIVPSQPIKTGVGFLCIIGGALLWWYTLTWLIDKIRARFDMKNIRLINQIIGGAVIIFSLLALVGTIFNLYTL